MAGLFKQAGNHWEQVAVTNTECESDREALLAGKFETVAPVQRDLKVGDRRIRMIPQGTNVPCK